MQPPQTNNRTMGRSIALYPGAFRPPHTAHYIAVRHLLTLPHINEVVVIISNRCRPIPGTTLALDAAIAQRIWSIYLQGVEKVRVEVAPHTAVGHAFEYFDHAEVGDTLLFCLGETDISKGDDRFRNLENLSNQSGIQARLIQAPTGSFPIRSTSLRAALVQGAKGRKEFIAALPPHLTDKQRGEVWKVCREGMREMSEDSKEKARTFINRIGLGEIDELSCTGHEKLDQVLRVRLKDDRCLFVKYAGDALGTEELGNGQTLKPRQRLSVERKALKWLRAYMNSDVEIPEVVAFDKKTWTLVLSEVCPNGHSLLEDLQNGIFNPSIARNASHFLAECHIQPIPIPALWGNAKADQHHWRRLLDLRTVGPTFETFPKDIRENLENLLLGSEKATENRFVHLDFHPKNILVCRDKIGVIDFELSSSVGDPAFDFGYFLGKYMYWILTSSIDSSWQEALQCTLQTYELVVGDLWKRMCSRMIAFTGATLLNPQVKDDRVLKRDVANRVTQAGIFLLDQGTREEREPVRLLWEAVNRN